MVHGNLNSFYVTQEKIELALETARHEAPILREVTDDTFSLYISIPFCPSRCSYCSFVSHDITSKRARDILPVYVDRLCEELEQISQKVKGTGTAPDHRLFWRRHTDHPLARAA